jgi:hypothetical protein
VTIDVSNNGFGVPFNGFPHDWTEGTGVFPAGGVITLPNPTLTGQSRRWLFIQNQDAADIKVTINATLSDGATVTTASLILSSGGGAGLGGGTYENFHQLPSLSGVITVTGTAGNKVAVLERLK